MIPIDFAQVAEELTQKDEKFQRLYAEYQQKLENYHRIMDTLSFEDRVDLDDFIAVSNLLDEQYLKLLVNHYATYGTKAFVPSIW